MRIDVYATQNSVLEKSLKDQLVVIVDVLRATTTITAALYNGCKEVIPVTEIEEAINMAKNFEKNAFLLGGERNSRIIDGFHLSNSPLEYTPELIKDKSIIFTTTNGTRAIRRASDAKRVLLAAFVNVEAIAGYLKAVGENVTFVCAGTEDRFSLDDIMAVGAVIHRLGESEVDLELDDLGLVCRELYWRYHGNPHKILKDSYHYRRLAKEGLKQDIDFCLTMDILPVVPVYQDGVVRRLNKEV